MIIIFDGKYDWTVQAFLIQIYIYDKHNVSAETDITLDKTQCLNERQNFLQTSICSTFAILNFIHILAWIKLYAVATGYINW